MTNWRESVVERLNTVPLVVKAWAIASFVAAVTGPFSTFSKLGFGGRLLYWGAIIGIGVASAILFRKPFDRFPFSKGSFGDALFLAFHAIVFGAVFWSSNFFIMGFSVGTVPHFLFHFAVIAGTSCFVLLARSVLAGNALQAGKAAPSLLPPPPEETPLRSEVYPGPVPGAIAQTVHLPEVSVIRVSADNHYVAIATKDGTQRILMRFRDALTELENYPGFRVHRSHWVSADAIIGVERVGRGHVVVLVDGTTLPVSKAYLPALREAGFGD